MNTHTSARLLQSVCASFTLALLATTANAAEPDSATAPTKAASDEQSKLKGAVVKVVSTDGGGDKDTDGEKDKSFGALTGEGLGKAIDIPTDTKEGEVKQLESKGDEPTKTASIDIDVNKKPSALQKAKAEQEDTVSKAEIGVDWSHWVSTLADRWFYNLKNMEFRSAKVFRTARPALIRFTCYRSGTIGGITLRQSCGVPAYDQMQIESLKRCTPLPPFPEGSRRMSYTLLQGWECHPRQAGEKDFKPGSYGKGFPVERVPVKSHRK